MTRYFRVVVAELPRDVDIGDGARRSRYDTPVDGVTTTQQSPPMPRVGDNSAIFV